MADLHIILLHGSVHAAGEVAGARSESVSAFKSADGPVFSHLLFLRCLIQMNANSEVRGGNRIAPKR